MDKIIWLATFVILIGIEAATMTLCTIWFAIGALVSFALTYCGVEKYGQVGVFFLVSTLLLVLTRPAALRFVNKKTVKTNAESLAGKRARITERIDNQLAQGTAVVNGQEWTARSEDDSVIEAGAMAEIVEIRGVKLIVRELKEEVV